jgi:hypothetical protein
VGNGPLGRIRLKNYSIVPGHPPFEKGNKYAAAEKMPPASHKRRMHGLFKAWAVRARMDKGERAVTAKTVQKIKKRARVRLKETVAKEVRDIQNLARKFALAGIEEAAKIAGSPSSKDSDKLAAINLLLDRAFGKATQTSINAVLDANGKPSEVTGKELDERIAEALKRVEDLTGRTPKTPKSEKRLDDIRERDRDTGGSSVH